jgi:hypothetical protein
MILKSNQFKLAVFFNMEFLAINYWQSFDWEKESKVQIQLQYHNVHVNIAQLL